MKTYTEWARELMWEGEITDDDLAPILDDADAKVKRLEDQLVSAERLIRKVKEDSWVFESTHEDLVEWLDEYDEIEEDEREGRSELLNRVGKIARPVAESDDCNASGRSVANPTHLSTSAGDSNHLQSADPKGCDQPNDKLYQSADTNPAPSGECPFCKGRGRTNIGSLDGEELCHDCGGSGLNPSVPPAPSGDEPPCRYGACYWRHHREQGIREAAEWLRAKGETNGMLTDADQMLRDLLEGDG